MSAPGIIASNFRRVGKNTLIASVDLTVPAWHVTFCGCTWHRSGDKEWVNFAGREWRDHSGERQFAVLVKFTDRDVHNRFQAAAIEAVHTAADDDHPPRGPP